MNRIALCCPKCGTDVPDPDLHQFVRFYNRDMGIGAECPGCKSEVWWQMLVRASRRAS